MEIRTHLKRITAVLLAVIIIITLLLPLASCDSKEKKIDPEKLQENFNLYLEKILNDGTYDKIMKKWSSSVEADKTVDYSALTGENGTIVFGTETAVPFVYRKNGEFVGFTMDIVVGFCKKYGYKIEIKDYSDSNSIVMATSTGKVDFGGSNISISAERAESIDFSIPYMQNSGMILVRKEDEKKYTGISSLTGHSMGVVTGTIFPKKIRELNPKIKIFEYNNVPDLFEALDTGKVDSIGNDGAQNQFVLSSYPNVREVFSVFDDDYYAFVFPKKDEIITDKTRLYYQLNRFITEISFDGTLNKIDKIWINDKADTYTLDYSKLTGENGTIKAAVVEARPFVMRRNGEYVGYTIDILYRFCLKNGYKLEFMSFKDINSSIASVIKGKSDIAASEISITAERKSQVNFSIPYYLNTSSIYTLYKNTYDSGDEMDNAKVGTLTGSVYPMTLRSKLPNVRVMEYNTIADLLEALNTEKVDAIAYDDAVIQAALKNYPNITRCFTVKDNDYIGFVFVKTAEFEGIIHSLQNSFYKTFVKENRWFEFVKGFLITLLITIASVVLGTILGFLVFISCKDGNKISNVITSVCRWIVDGTPAVVLLMIFYYVVFSTVKVNDIIIAIIVFTLIFMSSVIGILRMAYNMIDTGQFEASYALGYTRHKAFYKIILPQMIRHMWISFEQAIVEHIKVTAIVGFIAVQDLTKTSDIIRSSTYEAFFPLVVVAILYFFICYLFICIVKFISKKLSEREKKRDKYLADINLKK